MLRLIIGIALGFVIGYLYGSERARERVSGAIASAPVLAVQGTLRAVWMANELSRRQALQQVSSLVSLGTQYDNIDSGQQTFQAPRPEWRLR